MGFADWFEKLPLELMLEGLPLSSEMQAICQGLMRNLQSQDIAVAEEACLGLHRIAAEKMLIALCLEQAATLAEAQLAQRS